MNQTRKLFKNIFSLFILLGLLVTYSQGMEEGDDRQEPINDQKGGGSRFLSRILGSPKSSPKTPRIDNEQGAPLSSRKPKSNSENPRVESKQVQGEEEKKGIVKRNAEETEGLGDIILIDKNESEIISKKLDNDEDYLLTGNVIVFLEDANINWTGDGNLIVKTNNSIGFKRGSHITSSGKGGLILYPNFSGNNREAEIKFDSIQRDQIDPTPYIDVRGSVCLFYNPKENEGQQHTCYGPENWEAFIKVKHPRNFHCYMLIHDGAHLAEVLTQDSLGWYALGRDIYISEEDFLKVSKIGKFEGQLNYNGYLLSFISPPTEGYIYDFFIKNKWNSNTTPYAPPFSNRVQSIFYAARINNISGFKRELKDIRECYIRNPKGKTPLHIAAQYGSLDIYHLIFETFHQHFLDKGIHPDFMDLVEREDFKQRKAIQLAAKHLRLKFFQELCTVYAQSRRQIPPLKNLISIAEEEARQVLARVEALRKTVFSLFEQEYFSERGQAIREEFGRQLSVETEFFCLLPKVSKANDILTRFQAKPEQHSFSHRLGSLDGIPSHSRIILFYEIVKLLCPKKEETGQTATEELKPVNTQHPSIQFTFNKKRYEFSVRPMDTNPGYIYCQTLQEFQRGMSKYISKLFQTVPKKDFVALLRTSRISGKSVNSTDLSPHEMGVFNDLSLMIDFIIAGQLYPNRQMSQDDRVPISFGFSRALDLLLLEEANLEDWDTDDSNSDELISPAMTQKRYF